MTTHAIKLQHIKNEGLMIVEIRLYVYPFLGAIPRLALKNTIFLHYYGGQYCHGDSHGTSGLLQRHFPTAVTNSEASQPESSSCSFVGPFFRGMR